MKIGQAAKILGVSIDTIRRWSDSGKLPSMKTPGGTRMYSHAELVSASPSLSGRSHSREMPDQVRHDTFGGMTDFAPPAPVSKWIELSVDENDVPETVVSLVSPKGTILKKAFSYAGLGLVTLVMGVTALVLGTGFFTGHNQPSKNSAVLSENMQNVLAAVTPVGPYLEINTDTIINGDITANNLTFATELDQSLTKTSTPTFTSLTLSSTTNQLNLSSGNKITLPDATGTVVLTNNTQTLTNKTMSGGSNTFTDIPNSALTNHVITVTAGTNLSGGGDVNLGSSITLNLKDNLSIATLLTSGNASVSSLFVTGLSTMSGNLTGTTATFSGNLGVGGELNTNQFKLNTSPTAGYVLVSDVNGIGTWQSVVSGAGAIGGSGTLNYLSKFTPDGTHIGNSGISDTGSLITLSENATASGTLGVGGNLTATANILPSYNGTQNIGSTSNHWGTAYIDNLSGGAWSGSIISTQYGGTGKDWSAVLQGNIPYFNATGAMSTLAPGTANQLLITNGASANPAWANIYSLLSAGTDITLGGTTIVTINDASTLQTVTGRGASTSNAITLTAAGTALTINNNATISGTLGVGSNTTLNGDLAIKGNTNITTAAGFYQINGTNVLSSSTLGTGVLTSSLTTVGALNSGSITSGFGAIDVGADSITGGAATLTSATISGTLGVGGNTTINADLGIKGNVNITTAAGFYQINGTNVLSSSTLGTGVTTSSLTTVGNLLGLTVSGNATVSGNLGVGGEVNVNQFKLNTAPTAGYALISDVNGIGTWQSIIGGGAGGVGGSGTLNYLSKFTPDGTHIGNSGISDTGSLITLSENATASGTFGIGGNTTINADLGIKGNVNITTAAGFYQINGTNVLSSSTLGTGVTTSSLTTVGNLLGLTVSGNASISGTLGVGGEASLSSKLTFDSLTPQINATNNRDLQLGFQNTGTVQFLNANNYIGATTGYINSQQICTAGGNCSGIGGVVGGTGTQNYVAKWNNAGGTTIGNSNILDTGSLITLSSAASVSGALTLYTTPTIGTTSMQSLTLGDANTGNIVIANNATASGTLGVGGNTTINADLGIKGNVNITTAAGFYQINGANVLSSGTLGTGVTTSSLTTVGALASGSIASGFGTISTGNLITTTGTIGTAATTTFTGAGATLTSATISGTLGVGGEASFSAKITMDSLTNQINATNNRNLDLGFMNTGRVEFFNSTNFIDSAGNMTLAGTLNGVSASLGTITNSTWNGNIIGTQYGGTGQDWHLVAQGSLPYFAAGTGVMNTLSPGSASQVLTTSGAGADPAWTNLASLLSGTANQITVTGTQTLVLSIPSDFRAPGTVNAVNGIYTGATAGTERIDASGNLTNIGTASMSGALTLTTTPTIGTTSMQVLTLGGANTGSVQLSPKSTTGLFVDGNGNVGIGTTGPGYKLQVEGDVQLGVAAGTSASPLTVKGGSITLDSHYSPTPDAWFYLQSNGTNKSGFGWRNSANILSWWSPTAPGSGDMLVANATSGNVGIGTTNPLAKLDVNGTASISGALSLYGTPTIVSTSMKTLTLGDANTGDLNFYSTSNKLTSAGNLTLAGNIVAGTYNTNTFTASALTFAGASPAISASTAGTSLTIDANGAGTVSIGATSTGDVLLAGGSGVTGCTVTNSNGDLTCTGNITGAATGTMGYWTRTVTSLAPSNAGDAITTSGNISTSGTGTITSAGLFTGSSGATLSGALTFFGTPTISTTSMKTLTIGDALTGDLNFYSSSNKLTSAGNLTLAGTITGTTINGTTGINTGATAGTERIDASGNLTNIGTASMSGALTLTTTPTIGTTSMQVLTLGGATTGSVQLSPKSTTGLFVDGNGNVGIGTTGPGYKLSIAGASNSGIYLKQNTQTNTTSGTFFSGLTFENTTTTNAYAIGYNLGGVFAVNYFDGSSTYSNVLTASTGGLSLPGTLTVSGTGNTTIAGNVGIGTTNPLAKLDVNGTASISGGLAFYLTPTISSTSMRTLTLGDANTGDLNFYSSSNNLTSAGNLTLAGNIVAGTYNTNTFTASALTFAGATPAISASTAGTSLTIDANGAGTVSIGATSTGDVLLAGGSGVTGCTVTNSNGDLTCTGNITGAATGTMGYWTRTVTSLAPSNAGDAITTSGNISTSGTGTITSAGLFTGSSGATLSGALTFFGTPTISTTSMKTLTIGDALTGDLNFYSSSNKLTSAGNLTLAGTITGTTINGTTGINTGATAGTERIDASGNLTNIGTASMSGALTLTTTPTIGTTSMQVLTLGGANTGSVQLSPKSTTGLFVDGNGNVGIGTTGPGAKLNILGGNVTTLNLDKIGGSTRFSLFVGDGTGGYVADESYLKSGNSAFHFLVGNTIESLTLTAGGNVGIGTTNPGGAYPVVTFTPSSDDRILRVENVAANGIARLSLIGNAFAAMDFVDTGGSANSRWGQFYADGGKFVLAGLTDAGNTTGKAQFAIDVANGDFEMTNGNVGIGTTSPLAKLDVNGTASVSGGLAFYLTPTISSTSMRTLTLGDANTGDLNFYSSSNKLTSAGNLTLAGGISLTGTQSVSASTALTLGVGTATTAITSSDWAIGTTGDMTGIGAITADGILTVTNNATISGTLGVGSNVTLSGVSADGTVTNALFLNASNIITQRALGSNAFNSTAFLTSITGTANQINVSGSTLSLAPDVKIWGDMNAATFNGNTIATGSGILTITGTTSISGANTGDNAANSSTMYIGTTAHALNRASAPEGLAGITGLTPGADFTLNQNSVAVMTSVETGAIVNTLYLKAGNIGIGTTAPTAKLSIGGSNSTISNTSGNITIIPNANLIISSGNVGIGTAIPLTALDVVGSASISANLSLRGQGTAHTFDILDGGTLNVQRSPGGDTLLTSSMFINSSGNVGIGTTSPGEKLSIVGDSVIEVNGTTKTTGWYKFGAATSATNVAGVGLKNGDGLYFDVYKTSGGGSLGTDSMDAMVIKQSSGNVGIGTTGPSAKLDVNGTLTFRGNLTQTTGSQSLTLSSSTTAYNLNNFFDIDTTNSRVGIGTTAPGNTLDVNGAIAVGTYAGTALPAAAANGMAISGNVGIGTTGPGAKLDVLTSADNHLFVSDSSTYNGGVTIGEYYGGTTGTAGLHFSADTTTTGSIVLLTNSGSGLTKRGRISPAGGFAFGNTYYATDPGAGNMIIEGNVGIGTTAPARALDVVGSITASAAYYSGATIGLTCTATAPSQSTLGIVTTCAASSIRYKTNVDDLGLGLNEVMKLRPVTFDYKTSYNGYLPGRQFGFIAEEVEQVNPLFVAHNADGSPEGVKYAELTSLLTNAVKEQQGEIASLSGTLTIDDRRIEDSLWKIEDGKSTSSAFLSTLNSPSSTTTFNLPSSIVISLANLPEDISAKIALIPQIQSDVEILKTEMASMSAGLAKAAGHPELVSGSLADASLSAQINWEMLKLVQHDNLDIATISAQFANFSDSLKVIGATQLADTTIGGSLTVGLLHFDDLKASISSLTGLVTIDSNLNVIGDATVSGQLKVGKGMVLKDKTTGDDYCVQIDNGAIIQTKGECP